MFLGNKKYNCSVLADIRGGVDDPEFGVPFSEPFPEGVLAFISIATVLTYGLPALRLQLYF